MTVIWKTANFAVTVPEKPFISREEGGHIVIRANGDKHRYGSRLDFTPEEILEEQRLCQLLCEAYMNAMKCRGVDIIRLNFFEAGNWAWKRTDETKPVRPYYHLHIFGRTLDAKKQVFPEAPYLPARSSGFYDDFVPLDGEDIACIVEEMERLDRSEKYAPVRWTVRKE